MGKLNDTPDRVVSVTNGITQYDFLIGCAAGELRVRHRISACEDEV